MEDSWKSRNLFWRNCFACKRKENAWSDAFSGTDMISIAVKNGSSLSFIKLKLVQQQPKISFVLAPSSGTLQHYRQFTSKEALIPDKTRSVQGHCLLKNHEAKWLECTIASWNAVSA